jgi:hypothetical protein
MSACRFHHLIAAHALEPDEALAAHLPGCDRCRAALAEAEGLLARLEPAGEDPGELFFADLAGRVRAELGSEPPRRRWGLAVAPGLLAAAAAVWLWAGSRFSSGERAPEPAVAILAEERLPQHAGWPGSLADPDAARLADQLDESALDLALATLDAPDDESGLADLADADPAGLLEDLDDTQLDAASAAL